MTCGFDTLPAPEALFRVGRMPDVWRWADWSHMGRGRWDDPRGLYRVLYASCSRLGAFLEVLAPLRPDPELAAQLGRIRSNDRGALQTALPGHVPARWRHERVLGHGVPDEVNGLLVVVGGSISLATLRRALAGVARRFGLRDLDAAAIRLSAPRGFTQDVSRYVYDRVAKGGSQFAGLYYLSKHGDDIANCGIFEREGPFPVTSVERTAIDSDDYDFVTSCSLLGLEAGS